MRKIIAAKQTLVDGFIEGPNRKPIGRRLRMEQTWRDVFEMLEVAM